MELGPPKPLGPNSRMVVCVDPLGKASAGEAQGAHLKGFWLRVEGSNRCQHGLHRVYRLGGLGAGQAFA